MITSNKLVDVDLIILHYMLVGYEVTSDAQAATNIQL